MVATRIQASHRELAMPRVLELHKAIMEVTTPDQAKALVRTWVSPMQAEELKNPKETTKFCALIAEFVVGFMTRRRVSYMDVVGRKAENTSNKESADSNKAKIQAARGKVIYCAYGGHEFTIINDDGYYALFQAWADKFEVFPKLNDDSQDHNVIGQGDATLRLVMEQLAEIKKLCPGSADLDMKAVDIAA